MESKRVIPYGKQLIDEKDIEEVVKVLKSDYLTTGPKVKELEELFADYVGAKYAVAVANGTAALHLACLAAGIGTGDEVITTPMTFAASANCALYVGAKPVFADIDQQTNNINPGEINKKISPKTKAIIPVHYTGLPCNMEEIKKIADENHLIIIEDACHALGARYKETKIGDCSFSDMTVFSFHPVKHITTGEGGMITTNSKGLYEKLQLLRSHGLTRDENKLEDLHGGWYYEMQTLGYNYRITDIQCALGISQLRKVDMFIKRRREIAGIYNEKLKDLPLELPIEPEGFVNSYHLYVVKIKEEAEMSRKELYDKLRENGIFAQVHYIPVHLMPYYQNNLGYKKGDYPLTESHYGRVLSLPIYPSMTDEDVELVLRKVREIIK